MSAHVPVLLDRVLDLLAPTVTGDAPVVIDATLGLGGHTEALLRRFGDLRVIGIDRDPAAIERAQERLAPFGDRITIVHAVYDEIAQVVEDLGLSGVNGVLFDLGVSSMQLDRAERGFAYSQDAPLDMRMNPEDPLTAADVLNTYAAPDLVRVLREYGEERFASRIVQGVVARREHEPFATNQALLEVVDAAIPAPARRRGGNPAKRTFQALRIEVNDELGAYRRALPEALDVVLPGGRVVVMAYHSLEDRITKRAFAAVTTSTAPRDLPVVPAGLEPRFRLVTRGAEQATDAEIEQNRRAKPVRLRAVERSLAS